MTDRELLELAAKAAGFTGTVTVYETGYTEMGLSNHFSPRGSNVWRPLTDDADAFQLAVALDINTGRSGNDCWTISDIGDYQEPSNGTRSDQCRAMRRAIVRAAAEIGRTMT